MMIENCSWDSTVILITVIINVLLLTTAIVCFVKYRANLHTKQQAVKVMCLSSALFCLVFVVGGALFLPLKVSVTETDIRVNRIIGDVSIQLSEIQKIGRTSKHETENSIRTFASGGLWGYLGRFRSPNLGNYTMYVTNASQMITIRTKENVYIISSNNPDEIVEFVKRNKRRERDN